MALIPVIDSIDKTYDLQRRFLINRKNFFIFSSRERKKEKNLRFGITFIFFHCTLNISTSASGYSYNK